eukprot:gene762-827_t
MYWLKIESIKVRGIEDKGSLLHPQSPAVHFQIGHEELKTHRAVHSGIDADYPEVFQIEINSNDFETKQLKMVINIYHKSFSGMIRLPIATCQDIMKDIIPKFNTPIEVKMALKTSEIKKGEISFTATIFDEAQTEGIIAESILPTTPLDTEAIEKLSDESKGDFVNSVFGDVGEVYTDFHCALQTRIINYGRLYVTDRYLLFYSKIFGHEKMLRLPYHSIRSISRALIVIPVLYVETDFEACYPVVTNAYECYKQEHINGIHRLNSCASIEEVEDDLEKTVDPPVASDPTSVNFKSLFKTESAKYRYKMGVIADQRLPVSLATFARLFLDDEAPYNYKAYHESVKDTSVVMSLWQPVGASYEKGRDIKFHRSVSIPGISSTRGVKLQNYKKFGDVGLLLCSSTHLEDVPAGDSFSMDDCLEVEAVDSESVKVSITFQVTNRGLMINCFLEPFFQIGMQKWLMGFYEYVKMKCAALPDNIPISRSTSSSSVETVSNRLQQLPYAPIISSKLVNTWAHISSSVPYASVQFWQGIALLSIALLMINLVVMWRTQAMISNFEHQQGCLCPK